VEAEADINRKTFVWGVVLAWLPIAFLMVGMVGAFMEVSAQKTSGFGAVAGGLSGILVTYGLLVGFASPIFAIVLLIRGISQTRSRTRTFVAVISICSAGMVLLMCGAAVWSLIRLRQ
jgi:membrane-anchored protein YejM (alkaline phosphatase superfamily)